MNVYTSWVLITLISSPLCRGQVYQGQGQEYQLGQCNKASDPSPRQMERPLPSGQGLKLISNK